MYRTLRFSADAQMLRLWLSGRDKGSSCGIVWQGDLKKERLCSIKYGREIGAGGFVV